MGQRARGPGPPQDTCSSGLGSSFFCSNGESRTNLGTPHLGRTTYKKGGSHGPGQPSTLAALVCLSQRFMQITSEVSVLGCPELHLDPSIPVTDKQTEADRLSTGLQVPESLFLLSCHLRPRHFDFTPVPSPFRAFLGWLVTASAWVFSLRRVRVRGGESRPPAGGSGYGAVKGFPFSPTALSSAWMTRCPPPAGPPPGRRHAHTCHEADFGLRPSHSGEARLRGRNFFLSPFTKVGQT